MISRAFFRGEETVKQVKKLVKNKVRVPKQTRAIESRGKIIGAAMALFAAKGFHNTNVPEITARAGLATGTFYIYFNNKKEVFIEIIKRIYKNIFDKVLMNFESNMTQYRVTSYQEGRELAHFIVGQLVSEYKVNARLLREILAMVMRDSEIEKIRGKEEQKVVDLMILFMESYKGMLRVTDFEAAAVLLLKFMEEMLHQLKFKSSGIENKRLMKEIEDMICRYLLPEN
jgi:AcrR family transcriptional regulator